MEELKLYMLLLGCRPAGRFTEQHDVLFGIGTSLKDLKSQIVNAWPEVKGNIHIDAWREVKHVNGFEISIAPKGVSSPQTERLFFINLGGYKPNEFEEYHYKMIIAAIDKNEAIKAAKRSAFYKHTGFSGAVSHIDDKYGIDVDDIYTIQDILTPELKSKYSIILTKEEGDTEDEMHLGYLPLHKLEEDF